MNSRQLRLVLGFVAVFALVSVTPTLSGLRLSFEDLFANVQLTERLGNLLIVAAVGLVLGTCVITLRRHFVARRTRVRGPAVERGLSGRGVAVRQPARSLAVAKESALALRVRKAATAGVRVPELARQFGLSQDAVRAAIGREVIGPAARSGSSFRSRQPTPPAKPRATPIVGKRIPYQVTA